jgi:hypothetical protein
MGHCWGWWLLKFRQYSWVFHKVRRRAGAADLGKWAHSPHPLAKALNSKHSCTPYTHGALLGLVAAQIQVIDAVQASICQGTAQPT